MATRTLRSTKQEHLTDHLNMPTVVMWGATGDGATDDYAAIQAGLDALSPGAILFLLPGVYRTSLPLVIPPGCWLEGSHGNRVNNASLATEVAILSYIKPLSTFTGAAALRMLDREEGSYAADNAGQRIMHVALDGSSLGGSTIDGIKATGYVHDVYMDNVSVFGFPHNGVTATSYTRSVVPGGSQHPYSWTLNNVISQGNANIGFSMNGTTDTWMSHCQAIGNTSYGFFLAAMANSTYTSCRSEFNSRGYYITGSWGTGTGSGGGTWLGCSTDRNTQHGYHIDATGSAPLNIIGPYCRRDGRNSGTGGGSFAGIFGDSSTCPINIVSPNIFPGVDDSGSGTNSPQIGIRESSCTFLGVSGGGYVHAATTALSGNILRGPGLQTATGSTASPTRATIAGWRSDYTVNEQQLIIATATGTNSSNALIDISLGSSGDRILSSKAAGDAVRRFNLQANGLHEWGNGTDARDTQLSRTAVGVLAVGADDCLKTGLAATGSRPTASVAGQGAQFYDTTLGLPIWSTGSVWKDAAGNTV